MPSIDIGQDLSELPPRPHAQFIDRANLVDPVEPARAHHLLGASSIPGAEMRLWHVVVSKSAAPPRAAALRPQSKLSAILQRMGLTDVEPQPSWLEKLRQAEEAARDADPLRQLLLQLRGTVGRDGLEYISSQ
jgi:hypothetical protein